MLRKRLLGTVIVRHGWAVQSFGYRRWLPLGKPECIVENLDRWGADGIVVLSIDRGDQGPDLELLDRLGALGLSTPLSYGGGLATAKHARDAVRAGAERLVLDSVLRQNISAVDEMASSVGAQALVAALPLVRNVDGSVMHLIHRTQKREDLCIEIKEVLNSERVSEVIPINTDGEGFNRGYDKSLINTLRKLTSLPLLPFGGISNSKQVREILIEEGVAGVLIGNALNYREHTIKVLKSELTDQPLRPHR